ncbi:MAG: hypothetical protein ACOYW3_10450 [Bacteroidota bacterium]
MKNLIALLMVCGFAFAFVACGGAKTEESSTADTVATEAPAAADTTAADTTAADTTAAQ